MTLDLGYQTQIDKLRDELIAHRKIPRLLVTVHPTRMLLVVDVWGYIIKVDPRSDPDRITLE